VSAYTVRLREVRGPVRYLPAWGSLGAGTSALRPGESGASMLRTHRERAKNATARIATAGTAKANPNRIACVTSGRTLNHAQEPGSTPFARYAFSRSARRSARAAEAISLFPARYQQWSTTCLSVRHACQVGDDRWHGTANSRKRREPL